MSSLLVPRRRAQRLGRLPALGAAVPGRRVAAAAPAAAPPVLGSAPAAAQLGVHVGEFVAELASGDAVQEEVDGVVGVHQLEADGAREPEARAAARVAHVQQRGADERLQCERRRENQPRHRHGQQHVRHARRHRRLLDVAARAAPAPATPQDGGRVAAAQARDDGDVEREDDGERRERVRRELDVLELVAHEVRVRRRAAVRPPASRRPVEPGRPEEMGAGGDGDHDEREDDEAGAPAAADGGGVERQPDGDEAVDGGEDDQPGGHVEHHVEEECDEAARRARHVYQLETSHLHGTSTTQSVSQSVS